MRVVAQCPTADAAAKAQVWMLSNYCFRFVLVANSLHGYIHKNTRIQKKLVKKETLMHQPVVWQDVVL